MATSCTPALVPARLRIPDGVWLAVMVLLWGLSWPAMKMLLGTIPPLWLATLRFATAAVALALWVRARGRLRLPPRADWPVIASIGGLQMMAFTALGLVAMRHTDAGRAALLAYTTPVWVMLGSLVLLRIRPTRTQVWAIALGLGGVGIVCSPFGMDWGDPSVRFGNGLLLLGAACWAVVILHVRRHRWHASPLDLAPWQALLAALPLAAAAYRVEGPLAVHWTPGLIGLVALIGPIATSVCFVISAEVGRRIDSFTLSNATLGVPAIGVLSSAVLLGERPGPVLIAGLVLLAGAVVVASRERAA